MESIKGLANSPRLIGLTRYRLVFDSSAWIEHFEGTKTGERVGKMLLDGENSIITPNIVALEVVSKLIRKGMDPKMAKAAIRSSSVQVEEKIEDYLEIGELHASLRKKHPNISMTDAIILFLAKKHNASVVTKDFHLKGEGAIFIG